MKRYRLGRRLLPIPLLAALLAGALGAFGAPPAAAAPGDGWIFVQDRSQRNWQGERPGRDSRRESFRDSRRDTRDDNADRSDAWSRYQQRLSPDERRQLRRDLHDANRDLPQRRRQPRR